MATSSQIGKLRVNIDGLLELNSFVKGKVRECICPRNSKTDIRELYTERGHPSEDITWATGKAMGLQLTGMFKPCKDCALTEAKKNGMSKMALSCSMVKGKRLFIDISSPSTATMGGKKHWHLIVEDRTEYGFSGFLKEKSESKDVMISSLNDLKAT